MKVNILDKKVMLRKADSLHRYFGWPTVTRLKDGRLAAVASGFRLAHVCPFGKCVIMFSSDEGKTWSLPAPVIDTPLDDRDGGITAFGESSVVVTSFNNTPEQQRTWDEVQKKEFNDEWHKYVLSYLDLLEKNIPDHEKYLGSTYRISHDNGTTFGEIMYSPVSCPHGPAVMPDGSLLYVGRKYSTADDKFGKDEKLIAAYKMDAEGKMEFLGELPNTFAGLSCEPHTIVTKDGKIIVHIRTQGDGYFTICQSESTDGGRTFSTPHQILADNGGAPAHIIDDNGILISVYGYRCAPYGIRAMFSRDGGESWETDVILTDSEKNYDLGYPSSVVLKDGNILTLYYAPADDVRFGEGNVLKQMIWNYEI